MKKTIITIVIALLVGVAVGYELHQPKNLVGAVSPVNTTQTNGISSPVVSLSTASSAGTSTSILNNSQDKVVTNVYAYCTGVATTSTGTAWHMFVATTSSPTYSSTSISYMVNSLAISTSSVNDYASTSTFPSAIAQYWPGGSYLQFNFDATNTAVCNVSVNAIQL